MNLKELKENGFGIETVLRYVRPDPASKLMYEAAREGIYPFRPQEVNLEMWDGTEYADGRVENWYDYYSFRVGFRGWPNISYKFSIRREELHDLWGTDALGFFLAEKVYCHFRYGPRLIEPSAHHILGEN